MEKEKNVAVKIAIITGIFGIIVAMINILPDILRKSKHDIAVKDLQRAVKRGVKVIGAHRIEVSYFGKGKQVLVDFFFKKPNGTIRKKCRIELAGPIFPLFFPPMRGMKARLKSSEECVEPMQIHVAS